VEFSFNDLCELLTVLDQTDVAELNLKSSEFELSIRKGGAELNGKAIALESLAAAPVDRAAERPIQYAVDAPPNQPPASPLSRVDPKWVEITAPMVGTFYRSPTPDESPFVNVGDRISVGQTVCILEAMKLMNELDSDVAGEIVEILVENGEPVEYGQPLIRVNPL
jgi:acetyl-CoA carboxylase biotin carboxyl carrier protein